MPKKEERRLGGACFVKLTSLVELGRLSCALERAPFPLFAFKQANGVRLAAQADLFMGTPVFYYVDLDKAGEFLAYKASGDGEEVQIIGTAGNAAYRYAPIIKVNKLPESLKARSSFEDTFISMEVEDLGSLAKVGTYKMHFEEPPLPLFAFKSGGEWIIGTFARIDDYEEASIFFYTRTKDEPPSGFVKYAPDKMGETGFTVKADEPGFVPVKVIKLAEKHPLVEL